YTALKSVLMRMAELSLSGRSAITRHHALSVELPCHAACDNRNVLVARATALSRSIFHELLQRLRVARLSRIPRRQTARGLRRIGAECASVNLNENAAQQEMDRYLPDDVRAA